jgi:hypothetical protein
MAFFFHDLPLAAGKQPLNPAWPVEISAGTMHESMARFTIPAGTPNGAVIQMVPLPPRTRVLDVIAGAVGQAATFAVGDGDDVDRYITSAAVAAGAVTRMNAATGFGYNYGAAGDTIDIVFGALPTAGGIVYVSVRYVYE